MPQKKKHKIKILLEYANAILEGRKSFEIRKNDRDYKEGDLITFNVIEKDDKGNIKEIPSHLLTKRTYQITYVLESKDFPEGIPLGYCVFSIKDITL